ncbi:unnamed protein product [Soboliphyme baturini]|uniref:Vps4_C domain-containing protein n=1 Tax=Soboliphyme baturini TaxID=241478 RepID=A0A183IYG6_9BILA|nr:unnamed protein product [Soboliphyme baturini]
MTRDRLQALKAARSPDEESDLSVDVDSGKFMEEFFEQVRA